MAAIFSKAKKLFLSGKTAELFEKSVSYAKFKIISVWFRATLKENHPDLKKTNKNWIIYTFLKSKYSRFVKNYSAPQNSVHEYSDRIWWCWFQGEENAPPVVKACLSSVRKNFPDREIIVLTEKNFLDYAEFPPFILKKFREKKISRTLFSDLLRLELLIRHGGMWIDSTVFVTEPMEAASGKPLFGFKTNERNDPATAMQSWFMCAEKNNRILLLTRDLLYEFLKKNSANLHYFLFYFFMKIASEKFSEEWNEIPFFSDVPPHVLQRELFTKFDEKRFLQIKRMSCLHKLSYKLDESRNFPESFFQAILDGKI